MTTNLNTALLLRIAVVSVAVATLSALTTGCDSSEPEPSPTPAASSAATSETTAAPVDDAARFIDDATKSVTMLRTTHIDFTSVGIDDLLVTSYAADVTTDPAVASRGSASIKINGEYTQSDFYTADGNLWIAGSDSTYIDTGTASGKFDPAVLLDPSRGIGSIVAATTDPVIDAAPSQVNYQDTIKITGTIPAAVATVLVPETSFAGADQLPITLWVDPAEQHTLVQVLILAGEGSVSFRVSPARPFTTPPPAG